MNYTKINDVMIDMQLKTPLEIIVKNIKADAIDEFVDAITCTPYFTNMQKDAFRIFAEQLKEQKCLEKYQ